MVERSILDHPDWAKLRAFFRAEAYDRDRNVQGYVRRRLEILDTTSIRERAWLLALTAPCVCCGQPMHPIREREAWGSLYYAAACPPDVSMRCSRGTEARREYRRVVRFLAEHQRPDQSRLF